MAQSAPEEFVNQVRAAVDIVDVVGEYVQLKKRGRAYLGLCPFHSEKTPSFNVNAERQFYHCFGCHAGGDVFSFVMQVEQLSFPEALQKLADRVGLTPPAPLAHEDNPMQSVKAKMYEAYRFVAKLYHYVLTSTPYGSEALRYLENRGFTRTTIDEYMIGFAPESWDFVKDNLVKRNFPLELMVEAGLLSSNDRGRVYDKFRKRVIFPIQDSQGEVIGFGGRSIDGSEPKYLNSPETLLFNKSRTIFNLHRARSQMRKRNQAILFEGYADVIAAWQAGISNGIATLGTAFTEQQAHLIRRNTDQVILCYDGDFAGQDATAKAIDQLQKAGCTVRIAPLPQGSDPDDYIRQYGAEQFSQQVLLQAMPVTSFQLKHLRSKTVIQDEADKAEYVRQALEFIVTLPNAIERDMYERQLSEEYSLSLEAVKTEAKKLYKQQKIMKQRDKVTAPWNNSINNGKFMVTKAPAHENAERMLLYYMLRDPEIALRVQQECNADFQVDEHSALAAYLYAYYAEGHPADPGAFIHYVEDEKCKQLASGLAMMECRDDVSDKEIEDYIKQVNNYPVRAELQRLREQQKQLNLQAGSTIDEEQRKKLIIEAALLGMKIAEMENALREG
ncbi:DNA primase [Brevibacillus laterosporus]|uniref:DNA primase n=1 Tax=Brevibacillus laterosporus TaxID=1465 RepID=A0AAP3G9M5_BRELA|nr:DNA primase [Brevibacillus laterosporus]MCG7319828.1 DNA primase [Brevibacillus laterosporus]MCR8978961.1 DNA primase [Brevibacillus laterosporus]MCZ0806117.1 DNA primase [Brevibacillus laterosporus]MCZ0824136.1 DNA primase [Brevibacillus laterosporus]MCZ0848043.1 DNA primase [Brevibacillus laterosporus]